eukprot:5366901-Prymnesium_polylepis.3
MLTTRNCALDAALCLSASSTSLINPAAPAEASVCPAFALSEPTLTSSPEDARGSDNALTSAATSTGSPSTVPVPCASISVIEPGETSERRWASRSRSACA